MKNNKLFSILLALLVCLSMVVSASATTESDLAFTLESEDSFVNGLEAASVKAGETFTVTVNLEKNPGVLVAIGYVEFDAKMLELVSAKASAENVLVPESNVNGRVTVVVGDMRAAFTPADYKAVTVTGAVVELTFKVLEETDAKTSIKLNVNAKDVINAEGKNGAFTVEGDKMAVHTVSKDHTCDETKTVEANNAVKPTCTEAGKNTDILCAHCGAVLTEGEKIEAVGHTAGEAVIENKIEATCTEAGKYDEVAYCTVCEAEVSRKTVDVEALGHAWGEWNITTAPGCSTFGVQTRTCGVCGVNEEDATVPATGEHSFGEWSVTIEATVEAEGEETRTCAQCGEKETRSIAKLPAPQPKNNTLVIVIIVVVVLAGAGVAAYFVLKNKKK